MLLNMIGFISDIAVVLLSGIISALAPRSVKPQVKHIANRVLAIEDTPTPENKCYAVQVFDFSLEKNNDKGKSVYMPK